MKTLTIILIGIVLVGCRNYDIKPDLTVGQKYRIDMHGFQSKGEFRPVDSCVLKRIYTDYSNEHRAVVIAKIDWQYLSLKPGNGVADWTVKANYMSMKNNHVTLKQDTAVEWDLLQSDLK